VLLPFGPLAIVLHYLSGTHVRTPATHFVSKSSQSFSFSSFFFRQPSARTLSTFARPRLNLY
jgi:hypothetical protein